MLKTFHILNIAILKVYTNGGCEKTIVSSNVLMLFLAYQQRLGAFDSL